MNLDYAKVRDFLAKLPIKNPDKVIVPFRLRPAQIRFVDLLEDLQRRKRPPRVITVKSRRVGISAVCIGMEIIHCMVVDNADARITAHLAETAGDLFSAGKLMHSQLKAGIILDDEEVEIDSPDPKAKVIHFGPYAYSSKLTFGTAKTVAGGRGMGFSANLATEAAYYEQEGSFTSIFSALPRRDLFFGFVESTANGVTGVGGPFYEAYWAADRDESDFAAFFVGPQEDPTCVITNEDLAREIMARSTDPDNEAEERDLIARFHLTVPQLAWRRSTLYGMECNGQLNKLHTDFPYYPEQAFVSSGEPVFTDQEKLKAKDSVEAAPPARTVEIVALGTGPQRTLKIQRRTDAHITIWEEPEPDHYYYIGADAASGKDEGDFAAAAVYDGSTGNQVGEYQKRAGVHEFADDLDKLGRYYGRYMPLKQALLNPEISCNLGYTVLQRLRDDFHYTNFYRWKSKDEKIAPRVARFPALGWETTSRTREMIMNHFRIALMQNEVHPRSREALAQIQICERREFGMRWDVQRGHDDILMAHLICWIAIVQWPPPNITLSSTGGRVMEPRDTVGGTPTPVETALNLSPILEAHRQRILAPKRRNSREEWQKARERERVFI